LRLEKNLLPQAAGSIEVSCEGCSVGDGKSKLTMPGDPMLSQGVTVPKIKLGKLSGSLTVDKGRATFKDFRAHSPDVDIEIDGFIDLRDPLQLSIVHLYVRFRPSDALVKREPTIELMNNMLAATAKRPDGYLGFSLNGTLSAVMPVPSKEPPY